MRPVSFYTGVALICLALSLRGQTTNNLDPYVLRLIEQAQSRQGQTTNRVGATNTVPQASSDNSANTLAANAGPRLLTREECLRLALENNLNIRIARYNPNIQRFTLQGSYGYYDPNFNLSGGRSFSQSTVPSTPGTPIIPQNTRYDDGVRSSLSGTLPYGTRYTMGVSADHYTGFSYTGSPLSSPFDTYGSSLSFSQLQQPLLKNFWIDGARAQIQINKKNLKISELALEQQIMDTITSVEQAYFDLIAARDNINVAEMSMELKRQLLSETMKRVQVGVATPLDEKQVQAELANAQAILNEARRQQTSAEITFRTFVTTNYAEWYKVTPVPAEKLIAVPEQFDLNESWARGIDTRPDYLQLKLQVEKQGIVVKLQKNQIWPEFNVLGTYARAGSDTSGSFSGAWDQIDNNANPSYSIQGQVIFPLGNRSARSALKVARSTQEQIKDQLRQLHMTVLTQIETSLVNAKSLYEQLASYREATVFAEAALEAEQKKLDNGKSTPFFVLDYQNRLILARFNEIRALANYNKALSQFYHDEGTVLERNKIAVEFK